MPLQPVSLETLTKCGLDAGAVAWNLELAKVVRDLCDRPTDDSTREVVLKLLLKPVPSQHGASAKAMGQIVVSSKLPKQKTDLTEFRLVDDGGVGVLLCNPLSKEDADQGTFDDVETKKETHG